MDSPNTADSFSQPVLVFQRARLTAIDLFAGAGGATQGLVDAGFEVLGAVEFDPSAAATYRANHVDTRLWEEDIRELAATEMARELNLQPGELTLLKACPPCQGFSTLSQTKSESDPRNALVGDTIRFVRAFRPKLVIVENVPGLGKDQRSASLLLSLEGLGYAAKKYLVDAADFGVPQHRKRLIIIAVKGLRTALPDRLEPEAKGTHATVREAFSAMACGLLPNDELSIVRKPSPHVQRRIAAIPPEGNRYDLPLSLQLQCHIELDAQHGRGASASYGRLKWDRPSGTMTTRCTTPSSGTFLHPTEDRAITLREAACLQSFPPSYIFRGTRTSIERQIGNAVPVKLARDVAVLLRQYAASQPIV